MLIGKKKNRRRRSSWWSAMDGREKVHSKKSSEIYGCPWVEFGRDVPALLRCSTAAAAVVGSDLLILAVVVSKQQQQGS